MNHRQCFLAIAAIALCGAAGCSASAALVKRSEARIDSREAMTVMAAKLRPAALPVLWATTLASPEIDELVDLPGDRYLVGTTNFDTTEYLHIAMFAPQYGPLLCLDGRTGAVQWSFERQPDADAVYSILGTTPSIVLSRVTKEARLLQGLDPQTGGKRWELTAGPAAPVHVVEESGVLVIGAHQGKPLSVHDLATGKLRWKVPVEEGVRVAAVPGALLELGNWARARDLLSGQLRWSSGYPGPGASGVFPAVLPDGVVVAGSGTVARLGAKGELRWAAAVADVVSIRAVGGLVVLRVGAGPAGRLVALDLERGTSRWERPLAVEPLSPVLTDLGRLAYTTERTLELLDLAEGRTVMSAPLPMGFSAGRLADHVAAVDDLVVVVGEQGAMAVQATDGLPRWSHSFRGVGDRLYRAAEAQLGLTGVRVAPVGAGRAPVGATPSASQAPSSSRRLANAAIEHQQWVFSTTRGDRSASARASRTGAIEWSMATQRMAHEYEAAAARVQLSFAMMEASVSIGQQLAQVVNAQMQRTTASRRRAALELAQRNHFQAVQEGLAVRPVRLKFGDGLLLINLRTGAWAEVPVAPFEGSIAKDAFYDAQLTMLGSGRLVTKGIGLDPSAWQKLYASVGMSTVKRSMLAWDLAGLRWRSPEAYPAQSVAKRSVDPRPPAKVPVPTQVVAHVTGDAAAHEKNAKQWFESNRWTEAADEFAKAYRIGDNPALLYNMALCHRRQGNAKQALALYEEYLQKVPASPERPAVEARIKELQQEIKASERPPAPPAPPAVAVPVDDAATHEKNAKQWFESNRWADAADELAKAYRISNDPALLYNMALCHRRQGNAKQALALYEEYLQKVPASPERPAVETRIEELQQEIRASERPPTPAPPTPPTAAAPAGDAGTHERNARRLYEDNRWADAAAEFVNAYRISGEPALLFNMAICHRRQGHAKQALALYEEYLEKMPTSPDRATAEARVKELQQEIKDQERASQRPGGARAKATGKH